jgi:hypothetical protein
MSILDVFLGDAFSFRSLTDAIDRQEFTPSFLGTIPGLFEKKSIRTEGVWLEERDLGQRIIQTSPRGAPPTTEGGDKRKVRGFKTFRLFEASTVWAHELQGIREFGQEAAVKDLSIEITRRQMKINKNFELTEENMRLGAVQGIVVDADGSVLYDWWDEFSQTPGAEIVFNFSSSATEGAIIAQSNTIIRAMIRSLKGLGGTGVEVHALCGDAFWDAFTTSKEVRDTYKFNVEAPQLRSIVGRTWKTYDFGGILWHNYRGTDDNSTVAVPTNKVKFFPAGAGIFQVAYAPAERFEFVNTPGQGRYSWMVVDTVRDSFASVEVYSYPLHVCTMPQALASGTI